MNKGQPRRRTSAHRHGLLGGEGINEPYLADLDGRGEGIDGRAAPQGDVLFIDGDVGVGVDVGIGGDVLVRRLRVGLCLRRGHGRSVLPPAKER